MRLASCYFDGAPHWTRLARVLELTAAEQLPAWDRTIARLELPALETKDLNRRKYQANAAKLAWWVAQVEAAPDGAELLLIDADTLILRPLEDVWARPFDVALTWKAKGERPALNAGVVFVRVSPASRAFFRRWLEVNDRMLADPVFFGHWAYRWIGLNQSALGYILKTDPPRLALAELPCSEWNVEDSSWPTFDPTVARVLHIKNALRMACLHTFARTTQLAPLAKIWIAADQRARDREGIPA